MARVTVQDCICVVPNRFDLVLSAAQRARQISAGSPLTIERQNDKNPVVALREIAVETVAVSDLENELIQNFQKQIQIEEPEEEFLELLAEEQAHAGQIHHQREVEELELDDEMSDDEEDEDITAPGDEEE